MGQDRPSWHQDGAKLANLGAKMDAKMRQVGAKMALSWPTEKHLEVEILIFEKVLKTL